MSAIYTRRFIFFQGRVLRDLDHGWISLGEKFMFLQNCFIKSFFVFINSVINHPNLGGVIKGWEFTLWFFKCINYFFDKKERIALLLFLKEPITLFVKSGKSESLVWPL